MSENFAVSTVKGHNFTMDYLRFGEGERYFVMLPGMTLRPVTLTAAAVAAGFADFAKDYTVLLFDRRRELSEGCTVEDMAEDTAEAMELLGVSDADVYGASQGGQLAMILALRHPALVRRLVLAATSARPNPVTEETFSLWKRLSAEGDPVAVNRDSAERIYTEEFRRVNAEAFAAMETMGTPEELRRWGILSHACLIFDCYEELSALRCPTLVVGAEQDQVMSPAASREIGEKLGCECVIYENYGHAVYDEAPDFRERMLTFFRE